jgi:hypothetical protein
MANLNTIGTHFGSAVAPSSFMMRMGRRELSVGRDFRQRYSALELVLLRKWLIVLSRAR